MLDKRVGCWRPQGGPHHPHASSPICTLQPQRSSDESALVPLCQALALWWDGGGRVLSSSHFNKSTSRVFSHESCLHEGNFADRPSYRPDTFVSIASITSRKSRAQVKISGLILPDAWARQACATPECGRTSHCTPCSRRTQPSRGPAGWSHGRNGRVAPVRAS